MHPLGASALPTQRRLDRIAEDSLAACDTLHELDGPSIGHIDSRQQFQRRFHQAWPQP